MKKTILFIFVLTFYCSNELIAQDYDLPKFDDYIQHVYWPDTLDSNQIEYFDNGNIKIKYIRDENNKKVRNQYYENGKLKYIVKVKQLFRIDSTVTFDFDTYKEILHVHKGYRDLPDGAYEEYQYYGNSTTPKIKTTGQFENGFKTGQWIYHKHAGSIQSTVYTFSSGELSGPYIVYYPSSNFEDAKVKYHGQYKKISMTYPYWNNQHGSANVKKDYVRRVGEWLHYDLHGKLIEVVEYNQK